MTVATTDRAEFLKSAESSEIAVNTILQARWGDAAGDTSQSSALINQASAVAEATRQLLLMASVVAVDQVTIEGIHFDLEGQTVQVDYTLPGASGSISVGSYFGGATSVDILVIKARPSLADGTTTIEGLIRL